MTFEDYLLEHFVAEKVSMGTQLLIQDECPFCGGSGRLYVGRKNEKGICFKCGQGFGAVAFVAAHQSITRSAAADLLAGGSQGMRPLEDEDQEAEALVWFPPTVPVTESEAAVAYLNARGITQPMIDRFGITFCNQNVQIGEKIYWTENRVIVPIFDAVGQAVGWQGRDLTGKSKIKYLFMPGFKGAEHLFNIRGIAPGSYVIISEGVFDVFGWVRAGIDNAVGTFGKKISEAQVSMLEAMRPTVVFNAWDADAVRNKYEFVERHGHRFKAVRLVDLGDNDADELNKKALLNALSRAKKYDWGDKILALI